MTSLLGHMAMDSDSPQTPTKGTASLWVFGDANASAFTIAVNGRAIYQAVPTDALLPHLFLLIFALCTKGLESSLLFHAAVLTKANRAILLAGVVGSGKTTLAAAAAQSGWRFLSDELAVIDPTTGSVNACPLPMSIKEGSTEIIDRFYPGLAGHTQHHRPDEKWVRYLAPPANNTAGISESFQPGAILFPRFAPERTTPKLQRLAKTTALQRLAATGSSDRPLTDTDIQAMISLVGQTPCFSLDHGTDIDATLYVLDAILSPETYEKHTFQATTTLQSTQESCHR